MELNNARNKIKIKKQMVMRRIRELGQKNLNGRKYYNPAIGCNTQ